ncbi:MAG TPA: hypothetical protein VGR02_19655 [Thermoanaerobaculia bacterium]|nr:hypothetical protein [Thermoanaerobaculia bacterium]
MAELSQAERETLVRQIVDAVALGTSTGTAPAAAAAARPSWRIIIIIVIEFLQVIQRHLGDDGTISQ